jgi:hypothetical protein
MLQIKALYQSIDSIEVIGKLKCFLINDLLNYSQSIHYIDVTRKPKQHNDLRSTRRVSLLPTFPPSQLATDN